MDLMDKLSTLGQRASKMISRIETEEASKTALVLPFIQALGYDVFNPAEVVPEFTADVGIKKGEKVDYAIFNQNVAAILIECKPHGARLDKYSSQLYRYFSVSDARIAILTDGIEYRFYSDLLESNKLDAEPFLSLNLINLKRGAVNQVQKLTKETFDLEQVLVAAEYLRYQGKIIDRFKLELANPSDQFVRLLVDPIFSGRFTQQTLDKFRSIVSTSVRTHISEAVENRLRTALASTSTGTPESSDPALPESEDLDEIVTTAEELEGLYAVKAILCEMVEPHRVVARDVKSYFGILLDDNNRKPICRLWFNGGTKYLGVFDDNKSEVRIQVSGPNDLFQHAKVIRESLDRALAR